VTSANARREVDRVKDYITIDAAASPVLGFCRTEEAAGVRRTVPPVQTVKGTGLPFVGRGTPVGAVMGADQLQGIGVDRIRTAADLGIPPRWGPVRC
jgi:hypothetical protein